MSQELVIVLDFGGQYNQLVARRVRECNVYCEIYSYRTDIQKIKDMNPKGIILTGGPNSCYEEGAPTYSKEWFEMGIPVLGLCYGAQLMQHILGGEVKRADNREYGKTEITKGVIEVEEKPKTYKVLSGCYYSRINKSDIGIAISPGYTVILLEDDMEKAKEIFAENLKRKILVEKESIEQKIKSGNERISNWEKAIEEIGEIKESEE